MSTASAPESARALPCTVLVCALGGEGGGVLAEWLYTAAVHAGHAAQATSIPGVAQRTGATTYYLEISPQPLAPSGVAAVAHAAAGAGAPGRRPVFSLSPVPGAIDLLVASELLEAARQAGAGFATPDRTRLITSTARALTVAEKMQPGDGRVDAAALAAALRAQARQCHLLDLAALAREADTAISAVLLGAIAASGALPLPREAYEHAVRAAGKGVDASLRGFALAFDAVRREAAAGPATAAQPAGTPPHAQTRAQTQTQTQTQTQAQARTQTPTQTPAHTSMRTSTRTSEGASDHAPAASSPGGTATAGRADRGALRDLAVQRLRDYQDEAYAQRYLQRLARLEAVVVPASGRAARDEAIAEVERWLALWMAFDDVVRVAALKLARSRMARVRRETGARPDEVVRVYDHFKPGVPELAGLLPPALADRVQAWDRRRVASGQEPWALPLRVASHGVRGTLALRAMASLRRWRPLGQRFRHEQDLIDRWLAGLERAMAEHAPLALEVARCGRLIKGYGSTNERGKTHLLHVLDHLAAGPRPAAERAAAIRAAREAALADGSGRALDATLVAHGAPPRPAPEQVVRWFKRRPAKPA